MKWFSHPSNLRKKSAIDKLRKAHKANGPYVYLMLLEVMAESINNSRDLKNANYTPSFEMDVSRLCTEISVREKTLIPVLKTCKKWGLLLFNHDVKNELIKIEMPDFINMLDENMGRVYSKAQTEIDKAKNEHQKEKDSEQDFKKTKEYRCIKSKNKNMLSPRMFEVFLKVKDMMPEYTEAKIVSDLIKGASPKSVEENFTIAMEEGLDVKILSSANSKGTLIERTSNTSISEKTNSKFFLNNKFNTLASQGVFVEVFGNRACVTIGNDERVYKYNDDCEDVIGFLSSALKEMR